MATRPSRRTALTSAAMAGVLGLGGVVVGVAVPQSAQASSVELWRIAGEPDPVDRYTAVVDGRHLLGDDVVRPAGSAGTQPATDVEDGSGTAGFDPAAVLRGTAVVGEPAALERVDGVLRLRGPRGVYVLDGEVATAVPTPAPDRAADDVYARSDTSPSAVDPALLARLASTPGIVGVEPLHGGRVLLSVPRGAPAPAGLEGVGTVEPDAVGAVADVAGLPNDPELPVAWALSNSGRVPGYAIAATAGADLGVLGAWSRTRGEGVTVAVLDTGYGVHGDLDGTLWDNDGEACGGADADRNGYPGDCHGWNFTTGSADVTNASASDPNRNLHGTSVGSVIAGTLGNGRSAGGVAPDVELMPLVVGSGRSISGAAAIEALYYAADNGADVVNMSFGGNWGSSTAGQLFEDAMAYAAARGVLLVAAAGNDGVDIDGTGLLPATSANPNLLTVGASTAQDIPAYFSNRGRRTVDVYAPGMYVIAANTRGGTELTSGTSIASPLTAGVAALLKSVDPALDGVALRRRLMETVAVRSAFSSSATGGRVDARAALATVPDPLQVDVGGLGGLRADVAAPLAVRLSGTALGLPPGPLGLRVRIVTQEPDGLAYDVIGAPVDGGPAGSGSTDEHGTVDLAPAGLTADAVRSGTSVPVTTALPQGRYLAVLSLTSGGSAVTRSFAAPFVIGSPPQVTPPVTPTPRTPTPGTTAPAAPAPSAPAPSAPAPSAPAPSAPAPAAPAPSASSTPTSGTGPSSPTSPAAPSPAAPVPAAPAPSAGPTSPSTPGSGPTSPVPDAGAVPTAPATPVPGVTSAPRAPGAPSPTVAPAPVTPTVGPTSGPTVPPDAPAPAGPTPPPADAPVSPNGFGITHLSPGSGSTSGGQRVTLVGTHLPAGAAVLIGGVPARVVADDAPTSVTVLTPARAAGTVDVTVFGPRSSDLSGGRRSVVLSNAFTYVAPSAGAGPEPGTGPSTAPTSAPTSAPSTAPTAPGTAPTTGPSEAPAPGGAAPAPSASSAPAPSAPGTRGGLRLRPAPDVDPVLFGHAACGTSCTALRL